MHTQSTGFKSTAFKPSAKPSPGVTYRPTTAKPPAVAPPTTPSPSSVPPTTPSPVVAANGKSSAENKLAAVKFVRNPSHTYRPNLGAQGSAASQFRTPSPQTPAAAQSAASPPVRLDEPKKDKPALQVDVSSGLMCDVPACVRTLKEQRNIEDCRPLEYTHLYSAPCCEIHS